MEELEKLRQKRRKYMKEGDWVSAKKVLDKLIRLSPKSSRYHNRGIVFTRLAVADLKKALELDAENRKAKTVLKRLEKAWEEERKTPRKKDKIRERVACPTEAMSLGLEELLDRDLDETLVAPSEEPQRIDTVTAQRVLLHEDIEPESEIIAEPLTESEALENEEFTTAQTVASSINDHSPREYPKTRQLVPSDVQQFQHYQILGELGRGGMGKVYKALDSKLERTIALKVIVSQQGKEILAGRFLQEVKAIAKINHPNIISIYDFGEQPEQYYTMEYIDGQTLGERIKADKLTSHQIVKILKSVCQAIAEAHKHKVIHRDLKPNNIMLDPNDNPKVMDFGLAKFLESETQLSRSGDVLGTPSYMPPEQANGKHVDERSDIYSLGAVGYEILTGRPPFQGESVYNIILQVNSTDPIRPRILNPDISNDVETIVLKCLEKSPDKRYKSVEKLMDDLDRYLENKPILAKPPTTVTRFYKWTVRNRSLSTSLAVIAR